jgi:plasmid stability protein
MTVITIRNVPNELSDKLKEQARRHGQSLQQFLLRELADVAERSTVEERLREVINRNNHLRVSDAVVQDAIEQMRADRP